MACRDLLRACRRTSMIGHAINVPDPMSCLGSHHVLSVSVPSCWGGATNPFFVFFFVPRPPSFAADPKVVGSDVGSAPVEHLH